MKSTEPADAVMMRESPSPSIVAPAPPPTILTPRNEGTTISLPPSLKVVPSSSSITLIIGQLYPWSLQVPPATSPVAICSQLVPPVTFEM